MTLESRFKPVSGNPMLTYKWETSDLIELFSGYVYSNEHMQSEFDIAWRFGGVQPEIDSPEQIRDIKNLTSVAYQTIYHLAYDCGWADKVVPSLNDVVELDSSIFIESAPEEREKGLIRIAVKINGQFIDHWSSVPTKEMLRFMLNVIYRIWAYLEVEYSKIQIIDQTFVA